MNRTAFTRARFIAGFLSIPVLLYVVFVISPYAQAFHISMTNWRGVSATPGFVGLENFRRLLGDGVFWKAVEHNGLLLVLLPLLTIAIALFFAFLLNVGGQGPRGCRGVCGSGFYRVVFFFPQVLAVAIIAVLFQQVYQARTSGLLNGAADGGRAASRSASWSDPMLAFWSILGVLVWQAVGFYVVLFSAGMASIPREIYEAAQIDGARRVTLFVRVTLPLLWDTVQVAWIYLGIAAFDAFAIVCGDDGRARRPRPLHHRDGCGDLPERVPVLQVRLRLGDGRGAVLPDRRLRGAGAAPVASRADRVLMRGGVVARADSPGGAGGGAGCGSAGARRAGGAGSGSGRCRGCPTWR